MCVRVWFIKANKRTNVDRAGPSRRVRIHSYTLSLSPNFPPCTEAVSGLVQASELTTRFGGRYY
jgi:hypothetical protein